MNAQKSIEITQRVVFILNNYHVCKRKKTVIKFKHERKKMIAIYNMGGALAYIFFPLNLNSKGNR